MATGLGKILVFGGRGYIGKYIVRASIKMGHPTYVYGRPITANSNPSNSKVELHEEFQSMGVILIQGELSEHEKLVSIIKQVDIVISAIGTPYVMEQLRIIDAIKVAGNVKRFIPSDFGCEEDQITSVLPPFQDLLDKKKKIRRATEATGVPFTFLSSTCFGAYFLSFLLHPHDKYSEELTIYGTGESKAVFTREEDIAIYAIRAANDPRTRNRTVLFQPSKNILSQLELVSLWEKKTSRSYNKVFVYEEELVELSETSPHPENVRAAIIHSIFVKGDMTNFEIREDDQMEVTKLYPDVKYTTVDQLLDDFVANPPEFHYVEL
ncbi:hypothetical protein RHSIM_Rhsim07G0053600 [Rhododendron simsii]|uniref:NmrA-like domain-containing protein n=1 Tax=Rhododendron simsii TaxID=118357 RepID=A0A834GUV4_RHOSS|nr:hypothetical protein RHSIM_Rhsim07G0053600 [Rhododendron simsii]